MLNKNARKWVEALRSGEYEQERSFLKRNNKFCCLGVACELALKEELSGLTSSIITVDKEIYGYYSDNEKVLQISNLPDSVKEWLRLSDTVGTFSPVAGVDTTCLTGLNDVLGYSFLQIANFIESEPEGLFV